MRLALRRGDGDRATELRVAVEAAQAPAVRPATVRRLSATVSLVELVGVARPADPDATRYIRNAHDGIRRLATRRTCGWVGAELYLTAGIGVDRTGRTYEMRIRPDQPVATGWTRYGTPADPVLGAATAWLEARCASR